MKILFVTNTLGFTENIGIGFLSAIAKQRGHVTFYCSLDMNNLSDVIQKIQPDIVGYSVNVCDFTNVIREHKKAKEKFHFISIMGGPHPTVSPDSFKESGMDAYCIGEGEYAFRDFLECVEKGQSYDSVANLITREKKNNVRPLIIDLDETPMPDRDLILSGTFLKDTPKKTFFTSRGCPFGCTYCCNNYINRIYKGKGPVVRRFSVDRVLDEIEYVRSKYRLDFVKFDDDCFALTVDDWLREFSVKYKERIGLPFNCLLRFDLMTDEMLSLLKNAGCYSIHLSVESTSKYVRDHVLKRRMKDVDVVEKLRLVRKYGINTFVNYMNALPGSSWQDDVNTIFVSKRGRVTFPQYSTLVPFCGTEIYNYCVENRMMNQYSIDEIPSFDNTSTLLCFSQREKNIRFNVNLLGALVSKTPFPFYIAGLSAIIALPPNRFFRKIKKFTYDYYMENKIYKLH